RARAAAVRAVRPPDVQPAAPRVHGGHHRRARGRRGPHAAARAGARRSSTMTIAYQAQAEPPPQPTWAQQHYAKHEVDIPMRDGVRLHAAIYSPEDASRSYPILLMRTPYSVAPYGEAKREHLGPSELFEHAGYVFVYEDVRGCFMSGGEWENMRPEIA